MDTITPYMCVQDSTAAIRWYEQVLGATVTEPIMEGDRVGHVELAIGGGTIMMSDEFESAGVAPPDPNRGNAVTIHLSLPDVDAVAERAKAAGAQIDRGPDDNSVGRIVVFHDPFGHRWMVNDGVPR